DFESSLLTQDEGAVWIFRGGAAGIASGNTSLASARIESNLSTVRLGHSVAGAGDVNGDGYRDLIVGAPDYQQSPALGGAAFIFHGGPSGITATSIAGAATTLYSTNFGARLGWAVTGFGDGNADGFGDVAIGAPLFDGSAADQGRLFV